MNKILLDNYKTNVAEIDKNAETQKKAQSVAYQKLLKYLPEYNASMGITGGAAESTLLEANSDHAARLAQIESDAATQRNAAKQTYNQNLLDSYAQNYSLAKDTLQYWNGSSAELDDYIKGLEGNVSGAQYDSLLNQYKNSKEVTVEDEKQTAKTEAVESKLADISNKSIRYSGINKDFTPGDNFKVTVNNRSYKVQLGGAVSSSADVYSAAAEIGEGEIFYYDGEVYYKNGDVIHRVERRHFGDDEYAFLKTALNK